MVFTCVLTSTAQAKPGVLRALFATQKNPLTNASALGTYVWTVGEATAGPTDGIK
jgi:hypothetical protein